MTHPTCYRCHEPMSPQGTCGCKGKPTCIQPFSLVKCEQPRCRVPAALNTTSLNRRQVMSEGNSTARLRSGQFGDANSQWIGDAVSVKGGRSRALRLFPEAEPCEECGNPKGERHHRDGNTANNAPENVAWLCRRCHMVTDGRLPAFLKMSRVNLSIMGNRRWRGRKDTLARSGDLCPRCGRAMGVTATRHRNGWAFTYIGCRKSRGGCGYSSGSYKAKQ